MSFDSYYTPDSSFFEAGKFGKLSARREQKAAKFSESPVPEDNSVKSALVDMAQSSGLRELGDIGDFARDIFGGDVALDEGYSNREVSDEAAGLSQGARNTQTGYEDQVMTDIATSDWGNLPKSIYDVAPGAAADSAGTLASGLAGVGATAAVGSMFGPAGTLVGAGIGAANKVGDVADTVSGLLSRYQKIKKGLGKAGKAVSESSVMIAADTERQVQEYRKENEGEYPSAQRLTGMGLGSAIVMTAELGIGKGFLPKDKRSLTAVEEAVKAAKPTKGNARKAIDSLAAGVAKVSVVSGQEAAQEYVQQWQQILSKNVDPETGQSLMDAVKLELADPQNQLETKFAAAVGAGAGGATKTAVTAPGVALNVAANTTIGTAKTVGSSLVDTSKAISNRSARNKLSESDKRDLNNQQKTDSILTADKIKDLKNQEDVIKNAQSVDDLKANAEVAKVVASYQGVQQPDVVRLPTETDKQFNGRVNAQNNQRNSPTFSNKALENPETFKAFKEVLTGNGRKTQKLLQKDLDSSNKASFNSKTGKPAESNTVAPSKEQTKALITSVASDGDNSIKAAGELETSLAVDTVNKVLKDDTTVSEEALTQAKELSVYDLERVAAIVSIKNPETAKKLQKMAKGKANAISRFSSDKDRIVDNDEAVNTIAEKGIPEEMNIAAVSQLLSSTMGKKLKSVKAINAMQKAIGEYEKTKEFKKQGKGIIHPSTLSRWKKRLEVSEKQEKIKEKNAEKSAENSTESKTKENVEETEASKPSATTAKTKISQIAEVIDISLANNEDLSEIILKLPQLAENLKNEGYVTNEDFEQFIREYPSFKKDPSIYNQLQLLMYNPEEENSSDINTELSEEEMTEAFKTLFPGCDK